jgi:hypothetical protein
MQAKTKNRYLELGKVLVDVVVPSLELLAHGICIVCHVHL